MLISPLKDNTMPLNLPFFKSGAEIKTAIQNRILQLENRLTVQDTELDEFMNDTKKLRSYLIHSANPSFAAPQRLATIHEAEEVTHEEKEHVDHLCRRILELEQEVRRLKLIVRHLDNDREYELNYNDLVMYGFDD
jgi:predicted RNase H-like nuclease (RuvC/YqgF family)